jgi:hypothetical protein
MLHTYIRKKSSSKLGRNRLFGLIMTRKRKSRMYTKTKQLLLNIGSPTIQTGLI